jgi:hypothetical protein
MADMTDGGWTDGGGQATGRRPEPQGYFAGIPYDWRPPTVERLKQRWWNPDDSRLFTPRVWGWGYDLNLYWVTHPRGYRRE